MDLPERARSGFRRVPQRGPARRRVRAVALSLVLLVLAGCAAGRAFRRGEEAARAGNWDAAVVYYREAVQQNPDSAVYKIELERAMLTASRYHLALARDYEAGGDLSAALTEYHQAGEFDPSNQQAAAKASELERTIRDRIEAARPRPPIEAMRELARQARPEPLLNPASRAPLRVQFNNASLRDVLSFIGSATGINVTFDRDFQDRPYTVQLDDVTLEEALNQILAANSLFYKVINERTITVIPDTPQKRAQYEEQVIRTFYISHADVQELSQLISSVIRIPQMAVQPTVAINKTGNAITVRATVSVVDIIERIIQSNDKPPAEIIVDVEILEVNRSRAKQFGLNLSNYSVGGIFSPEAAPSADGNVPFNLNTVSQGVSTADFYATVPSAVVSFLESDSQTKLIAKPQLRGTEGSTLTLNLGDEIPVPSTVFTPIATGGAATNPLTSFSYRPVGVNVEMTPRVTFEGDIILELTVESSTLGQDVVVAGNALPSFGSRRVTTRLRLRDGESNLLAGLLREDERRSLSGFPGAIHVPILRELFSNNDTNISQTDIVMLLTPRIVRTHELTQQDLSPIFIGTQQNIGLGGPPPLIAPPPGAEDVGAVQAASAPDVEAAPTAPGLPTLPVGSASRPMVPAGSSPIPGTTTATPSEPLAAPAGRAPAGVPPRPQPTPTTVPPPLASPPPAVPVSPAQILVTPPGTELEVGAGPYTLPISVNGASRLSNVTLTLTYDPALVRIRAVQEGSFMRQGGVPVQFTQAVDLAAGRVTLTFSRGGDTAGASGTGLLAAVLFEVAGSGTIELVPGGSAMTPTGAVVPLEFTSSSMTAR